MENLCLVPYPKTIIKKEGTFCILKKRIVTMVGISSVIAAELFGQFDFSVTKAFTEPSEGVVLICDGDGEDYKIEICESKATVSGGEAGIFYGVQTLLQLTRQFGNKVPCMTIIDRPDIAVRGYMLDISRGRIPTFEYLKSLVDTLAKYKVNQLHLYVENAFCFSFLKEQFMENTPITPEEILALDEYCRARFIELVPCLATFGHLYDALNCMKMRHLRCVQYEENADYPYFERSIQHTINPLLDESFEVIKNMLYEYLPLFTSNKVNINGDETFAIGRGETEEAVRQTSKGRLYLEFLKKVIGYVKSLDKEVMCWGDIILSESDEAEYAKDVLKDVTLLNWNYAAEVEERQISFFADLGLKQYLCPSTQTNSVFIPCYEEGISNITVMTQYAVKYKTEGVLLTQWGDFGHTCPNTLSYPLVAYCASLCWNGEDDIANLKERISLMETGIADGFTLLEEVKRHVHFDWWYVPWYYYKKHNMFSQEIADMPHLHVAQNEEARRNLTAVEIDKSIERLLEIADTLESTHSNMRTLTLMLRGQAWLNMFVKDFNGYTYNKERLIADIEDWLSEYTQQWLSEAKPSELYRMRRILKNVCRELYDKN